jgi:hypothetical protein
VFRCVKIPQSGPCHAAALRSHCGSLESRTVKYSVLHLTEQCVGAIEIASLQDGMRLGLEPCHYRIVARLSLDLYKQTLVALGDFDEPVTYLFESNVTLANDAKERQDLLLAGAEPVFEICDDCPLFTSKLRQRGNRSGQRLQLFWRNSFDGDVRIAASGDPAAIGTDRCSRPHRR